MWRFHGSVSGKEIHSDARDAGLSRGWAVLIWTERIFLVAGLWLVMFYGASRFESWLTSRAALKQFADARSDSEVHGRVDNLDSNSAPGSSDHLELPQVDFGLWGERRRKAYKQSVDRQSGMPLAVLRIPKIHLEAPLFDGTDELTLNHAVGRITGTARPGEAGNIGIAGHRDGFFRGLKDVEIGDAIELKTLNGTTTYKVERVQIVSPRQVEVLRPTSVPSLTLVTCYPFHFFGNAPQRYIVTASLSQEKNGESENLNLSAPATENNSTGENR